MPRCVFAEYSSTKIVQILITHRDEEGKKNTHITQRV